MIDNNDSAHTARMTEKAVKEWENFLSYDGDRQAEIE